MDDRDVADDWALCDRNRFSRVILNLLSNACKFTEEGGRVDLALRQVSREGDTAVYELLVRDNGIGMTPEFAANVFTPFEREHTSTDSGLQGMGLGLSITKGIVDSLGETIRVDTAPGQGPTVTVRLPLQIAEKPAPEPTEEPRPAPDAPRRLLLAEDNMINLEIASMILTEAGFLIETAENGQVAVDKVKESAPGYYSAVLMDIQMPVMDGYAATRTIRALEDERLRGVPIIAMTANAFKEDQQKAADAGMQGHIAKPLDVGKMLATINAVLSGKAVG